MAKKRLKIAFLNFSFGAVDRGAEVFVKEVSRRLEEKGYQVDILTAGRAYAPRWPILWRLFLDPQGIQICFFTLKNLSKIWREKYDVVIPIDGGWQPAWVRLATWLYGGKMVVSGQSGRGWDDRNNLWSFPNAFVAISNQLADWARKFMPFIQVKYVPNGVDVKRFSSCSTKYKLKLVKPVVLCVAALEKDKRIDLTIRAVARTKASLLVVGRGSQEKALQELGSKFLGKRFQIVSLPFKKMPEVYRAANIFTFPTSSHESFGIAMLEAMASGLPVVATDDPIRREIVGKAGLFVDPTDISVYATALNKALEKDWSDKPRKQAEKFGWDIIASKYEKLFLKLCQK